MINGLRKYIDDGNTAIGVGVVSLNTVDAAIEVSKEQNIPVMLIASRRQVDDREIQKGYVNNWSTDDFAEYVNKKKGNANIITARDHGGPWQNNIETEKSYSLEDAVKSAKESYEKDIDSGFEILHIDPSIDIFEQISFEKILDRITDLYCFCEDYARKKNRQVSYEIGTEEQMIHLNSPLEYSRMLLTVKEMCAQNYLPVPMFIVTQVGTKVMELKNIGILNGSRNKKAIDDIKLLSGIAKENGVYIKVHNTDYLAPGILKLFPELGLNSANVAPEFGVCETKSFLKLLELNNLLSLANDFLELAYNSQKWEKWIISGSRSSRRDKAIIAGHYVFSCDSFKQIKEKAQSKIKDTDIDTYLKNEIKSCIMKYVNNFTVKNEAALNV